MRRHGFLAIAAAGVLAGGVWLLQQNHQLGASEEQTGSFREAFRGQEERPEPVEDRNGIRLNYFESNWDRVLQSVADQAELTLVMDRVPHGRFARRDRAKYELASVIRILNAELETQGFRLIRKGNFLIVLKLDQARTRYARPVLTDWERDGVSSASEKRNPFYQVSGRKDGDVPHVAWAAQQQTSDTKPNNAAGTNTTEQSFADRVVPTPKNAEASPAVEDGPVTVQRVPVKNGKASDVARSIYLVFESRAELIKEGLEGLPTFAVQHTESEESDAKPMFRVAIDQARNELVIEASKRRASHLSRLVAEMDRPPLEAGETLKLVPNNGVADATAKDLNEQIHRMVAMRSQTAEQQPGTEVSGDEGALNLRGEVNVQAMQDLGILILKGNEADVAKVEAIIKQLEEMSVGSLPDIHLLSLQYVGSEALAQMLSDVYERLAELCQRGSSESRSSVAFFPVVQPNSVLILAPAIELDSILQLAEELDRKTDPNSEFKVFSLRNAVASQVAESLTTFYEERGGLGTRIRVIADVRTNSVIVQGRPNDLMEVAELVEKMDHDEPGAVHRIQVVELKHATAEELAETISTAIQSVTNPPQTTTGGGFGGNQGAQELRDSRSVALEFLTASGSGRELIRSGILVDVRVSADARSNSLLVSAPEASMPLMLALIGELDRSPSAVAEIKVFALRNADAEQSVELLTTMFENQNNEDQLGVQIAGAEDAATSLIPVQFTADIRTNTVLAVGSAETLSVVEAILLRLDTSESRQRETVVLSMQNVQASIVADALDNFLQQQQELQDSSEDLVSNIERLRQEVIVAPDDNSNSLIVSASPEYFSQITQIIEELDANPPQVVIQALLVEVQLDNTDEFGVELGFQDPTLFSRSILESVDDIVTTTNITQAANGQQLQQTLIQSQNRTPGFNFNNTVSALGNNTDPLITNPATVATQGISNFSLGRQNGDLGFGGFVFSAQSDAVSVLVRALAARRTVHVLSRPQIRTTHNNLASIEVGQQVPVVDGVAVTNNFVTPEITQQNVGIILEVTPRVTPDGTINMDVYAEKSALAPGGVPVFTDVTTGNVVESVIIDTAIADTTVAVPNGQTIVIGGMITKSDETLERKVPWLGDLPLIGSAFRYDGTNTVRTELLIFLTPRIIYSDADSELIKQVESERLHFLESEAEEIHGPIFSVPPAGVDRMTPPYSTEGFGAPIPTQEFPVPPEESVILPPQTKNTESGKPADEGVFLPTAAAESGEADLVIRPAGAKQTSATASSRIVTADSKKTAREHSSTARRTESATKTGGYKTKDTDSSQGSWFDRFRRRSGTN